MRKVLFTSVLAVLAMCSAAAAEGLFAVSAEQTVTFASGNLQYQASTNTWQFAANQWDIIGDAAGNTNYSSRDTQADWIDLFAWATAGYQGTAQHYQPWDLTKSSDYGPAQDGSIWPGINGTDYDWGAAMGNNWRTLTEAEWYYVLSHHAKAFITTPYKGLLVLPISYPVGETIVPANFDTYIAAGALFLPAAGWQNGKDASYKLEEVGTQCNYWSSSCPNSEGGMAYALEFEEGGAAGLKSYERYNGFAVRLAKDAGAAVLTISDRPASVEAQKSLLQSYKESTVNVRLERTLYSDGWNTLCLPFSLTNAEWKAAFGAGTTLAAVGTGSSLSTDGETLVIDMVNQSSEDLQSGVAYIIIPETTGSSYYFENVKIEEFEADGEALPQSSSTVQFLGIINRTQLTPGAKHYLFVTATDELMWPDESDTGTMFGTRAYFFVPDLMADAYAGVPARIRLLDAPEVSTAIENNVDNLFSKTLLDGQLLITVDGKQYNILGQVQ